MMRLDIWRAHLRQKKIYQSNYRRFGDDHRALCWSSLEVQRARFEALIGVGDLRHKRLLDIGCGLGDFFDFLKQRQIPAELYGYDIVPEMVRCCVKRFPEATVECRNLLLSPSTDRFDYAFASGLFAFGNASFFREMTERAFAMCTEGFAFNIYESWSDEHFRFTREAVLEHCQGLHPRRCVLVDGYCENDFTVMLYH